MSKNDDKLLAELEEQIRTNERLIADINLKNTRPNEEAPAWLILGLIGAILVVGAALVLSSGG